MKKTTLLLTFSSAIAATALYSAEDIWATPALGFTATILARGTFAEIDLFDKPMPQHAPQPMPPKPSTDEHEAKLWLSMQKTRGATDMYVQSNIWQPGGSTGWHTHPGHSLIIVTEGAVSEYEGSDPECKPHIYTRNMTFIDPGGDHVHIIRNEGEVVAQTTAVQLIPTGTPSRIDAPDPGNCHF